MKKTVSPVKININKDVMKPVDLSVMETKNRVPCLANFSEPCLTRRFQWTVPCLQISSGRSTSRSGLDASGLTPAPATVLYSRLSDSNFVIVLVLFHDELIYKEPSTPQVRGKLFSLLICLLWNIIWASFAASWYDYCKISYELALQLLAWLL